MFDPQNPGGRLLSIIPGILATQVVFVIMRLGRLLVFPGPFCVAGNKNFTARQWRETIEISVNKNTEKIHTVLMVIDSENPKINDLRTAMMIGEMMSVPTSLLQ